MITPGAGERDAAASRQVRLLLFRLGDHGYATQRRRVRAVIDVGAGHPPVPGLPETGLRALHPGSRPAAVVSLRRAIGLPEVDRHGRILVVSVRSRTIGFLVDEIAGVVDVDDAHIRRSSTRLGGYVAGHVDLDQEPWRGSWSLIEWEALRLPAVPRSR